MYIFYKKSILILAISSITACTQYKTDNVESPVIAEEKFEVEYEQLKQSPSITTVKKDLNKLPIKKFNDGIVSDMPQKLRRSMMPESIAYSIPAQLTKSQYSIDNENYKNFNDNPVNITQSDPVSTFSIDVDTGAYSNMRRMLNHGQIPPHDAIRVEELINYFSYDYPLPDASEQPFSISTEMAQSPWNKNAKLLHIGIQGYKIEKSQRPAANLIFLVDVSGSMNSIDKLGLLKSSFKLLTKNLRQQDRVAIVVYAGAAGTVLESTAGDKKSKILQALNRLNAGGSTNGAAGINLAYQIAKENHIKGGINRVIIATDGDFNVGTSNFEQLKELVERKRQSGISLTTLGFGSGNYNDALMEQLADVGNGNYAYIDTLKEANKVLVQEMSSTLMTIAKDVKIQIEFNPNLVSQYRLIGYENRILNNEDFNNDKIDAGEIGAGHTVTALYEVVLTGNQGWVEALKYQNNDKQRTYSNELATLKIRYKQPDSDTSQLIVNTIGENQILDDIKYSSNNFKLSAAVAAFGQILRGGKMTKNFNYNDVRNLAQQTMVDDKYGYRGEFLQLVSLAESLSNSQAYHVE